MAKVETDGNGGAMVRFGFKEYATITTIVATVGAIMVSIMIYIVDLKFEAVKGYMATIEKSALNSHDGQEIWKAIAMKADKRDVPPEEVKKAIQRLEEEIRVLRSFHER